MKISLIVTSINKVQELDRLFQSITLNNFKNLEIIFVNQAIDNTFDNIVHKYQVLNIKEIKTHKIISLSKARNIGLRYITGDIVAFPDDDCWFEMNFFNKINDNFNYNDYDAIFTSVYDPINNKVYAKKHSNKQVLNINKHNVINYATSINMFIKKEGLSDFNFDEEFGVGAKLGGGEDLDLALFLMSKGVKIVFLSELKVYHLSIESNFYDYIKVYKYSLGYGALLKKGVLIYKNYYCIHSFLKVLFKSILAYIAFIGSDKKRKRYQQKIKGYINSIIIYRADV